MSHKKPEQDDDILAPHKIPVGGGESFLSDWEEKSRDIDNNPDLKPEEAKSTSIRDKVIEYDIDEDDWDPQF